MNDPETLLRELLALKQGKVRLLQKALDAKLHQVHEVEEEVAAVHAWQQGDFVRYVAALEAIDPWFGTTHGIVQVLEHHGALLTYSDDPHAPVFERAALLDCAPLRSDRAGRPYSLDACLDRPLPDEFVSMLRTRWLRAKVWGRDEFAWALAVLRNSGLSLSKPHELDRLSTMPEIVAIFRGFHVDPRIGDFNAALRGFSWSPDRALARQFGPDCAVSESWSNHTGYVVRAMVPRHMAHSYIALDGYHEIIIDRPDLIPVEAIEIVETQPVDRTRTA